MKTVTKGNATLDEGREGIRVDFDSDKNEITIGGWYDSMVGLGDLVLSIDELSIVINKNITNK